jgi:hypothetical protein
MAGISIIRYIHDITPMIGMKEYRRMKVSTLRIDPIKI